jgi:predicted RecB family endonuclease
MSIQKIIQESINGNPLEMKEALQEELRDRIRLALESKMDEDMSEEVEELDELKKSTLASYVRKASDSMGNAAHSLGKKSERSDEVDRMTNRHMPDKYNVRDNMKKALDADEKSQRKDREVIGKRMYGIRQATSRLSKD